MSSIITPLSNVNSEAIISVVEQFPNFTNTATEMVTTLQNICDKNIEEDTHTTNQSIEAYKTVISDLCKPSSDALSIIIMRDDLTFEEQKYYWEKMIEITSKAEEIADKISLKDSESKEFKLKNLDAIKDTINGILAGILTIGAIITYPTYMKWGYNLISRVHK